MHYHSSKIVALMSSWRRHELSGWRRISGRQGVFCSWLAPPWDASLCSSE